MQWLSEFWANLTLMQVLFGVGIFLLSLAFSFGLIAIVMVNLPAAYFSSHYNPQFMTGKPWIVRWSAVILKNILGVFLILLGIALSLPGVPGQGFLTILLGIIMLDIPGKRPIEARIIKRPSIQHSINKLRARFDKPPLILD